MAPIMVLFFFADKYIISCFYCIQNFKKGVDRVNLLLVEMKNYLSNVMRI